MTLSDRPLAPPPAVVVGAACSLGCSYGCGYGCGCGCGWSCGCGCGWYDSGCCGCSCGFGCGCALNDFPFSRREGACGRRFESVSSHLSPIFPVRDNLNAALLFRGCGCDVGGHDGLLAQRYCVPCTDVKKCESCSCCCCCCCCCCFYSRKNLPDTWLVFLCRCLWTASFRSVLLPSIFAENRWHSSFTCNRG